jgi:hypothetical protein
MMDRIEQDVVALYTQLTPHLATTHSSDSGQHAKDCYEISPK